MEFKKNHNEFNTALSLLTYSFPGLDVSLIDGVVGDAGVGAVISAERKKRNFPLEREMLINQGRLCKFNG